MCPSSTSLLPWALHCCFQHDVRYMYLSAFTRLDDFRARTLHMGARSYVGGVPGVSLAVFACRTAPIERRHFGLHVPRPLHPPGQLERSLHGAWRKCLLYGHQYWPLRAFPSCVLPSFPSCCSMPSLLPKCRCEVTLGNLAQVQTNVNSQRVVHNARKKRHKQDKQKVDPSDRRDSCTLFVKA